MKQALALLCFNTGIFSVIKDNASELQILQAFIIIISGMELFIIQKD